MLAYAKTGIVFDAGEGFIFTGVSTGDYWEIDKPIAGNFLHGVTQQYTDENAAVPVKAIGTGPIYVEITTNITAGDFLTASTAGEFKLKGTTDRLDGVALTNGVANDICAAIIISLPNISLTSDVTGLLPNANLANSTITAVPGTGMTGGGVTALGGNFTFSIAGVTADLGGTGLSTITSHGVMMGNGTGAVNASSAGTAGQVFTSAGAGADGYYADVVTGISSTTTGPANYVLSSGSGVYEDIGMSVTLPSAGTYALNANIRSQLLATSGAGANIQLKFYNATDSADVANSERLGAYCPIINQLSIATTPMDEIITVAASKVIKVYASRNTGTAYSVSAIVSDTAGRSRISYKKMAP